MSKVKWTMEHIKNLKDQGKIQGFKIIGEKEDGKPKSKRPKYGSHTVEFDGRVFQSRKEYRRYRELLLALKAGAIGQLRLQEKYVLIEAVTEPVIGKRGKPLKQTRTIERKTEYWADFVYIDSATGETIVEDVKSEATRKNKSYIIKRKLMLEKHGIRIKEV